jgi:hypothetical protein
LPLLLTDLSMYRNRYIVYTVTGCSAHRILHVCTGRIE